MQSNVTRCLGLVVQYNPLTVGDGALVQADDCVIRRENTIENRRGYADYLALSGECLQLITFANSIVAHNNTTTLTYDNGGSPANFSGSYSAPSGRKTRSQEANGNLYFTTSLGVKCATSLATGAGTIRATGAPKGIGGSYTLNAAASGFLTASSQCAYRYVIQRTDANSNVLFGYPSPRLVVYNTAATAKNIDLRVDLPSDVTTADVVQIYRTTQQAGTASDLSGDECKLAYQASPTSADISNGYLSVTDSVDDALLGATLYTSPSQEQMAQANELPPLAKDIALYKSQFMFYANTSTKQRLYFTLVGTSGLTGKTITLAGVTYNFGASEITSGGGSPQVQVFSGGLASTNIDSTARSLVRVINRYASNTSVYAYYVAGDDDLPGKIMVEARTVGTAAFTIQASDTTISGMFFPPPPVGSTNAQSTSSNQVQKNALYYSKVQQPEHVPAGNYLPVGPSNREILRIVALRDSLIVIKEEGVYRVSGESAPFTVTPLDLTVFCKAADSVAVLANQVFMLSNQGVVSITDTGVQVVSREVEPLLLPLLSFSTLSTKTYGAAYESERLYLLSTMTVAADSAPTQTFVFNIFTRTWTRWTFGFTSAVVEPSADKLYFALSGVSKVYRERKDFADSDYADPDVACTVTAVSGTSATVTSASTPQAGWALSLAGTSITITAVSGSSSPYALTLAYSVPAGWSPGAGILQPAIAMNVVWDAWTAGQPGLLKQVRQAEILTDNITGNSNATALSATFKTDIDGNQESVSITNAAYRWGQSPWGSVPWGGVGDTFAYPTYVPRNKQYCRVMNAGVKHQRANEKVSISGISYTFEVVSERVSK